MKTADFLATHPVFSLEEATNALVPPRGRAGTVARLKHHLANGRLKPLGRGTYAVVPAGVDAKRFQPDAYLVARSLRPDAVFSHHSALELLGVSHSVWNRCTLYTARRRRALELGGQTVSFLDQPHAMRKESGFATRGVERQGSLLRVTGPERTLVEGFSRPALAGGLEELVVSAGGFVTLDLELLEEVLRRYDAVKLWAAVGWFLERFSETFHVSDGQLHKLESHRPASAQYLVRASRGGSLVPRWNLILPPELTRLAEPDER